jgi:hypothetical protein
MRRPYRLHVTTPFADNSLTAMDFGQEATSPSYTDRQSKRNDIGLFIWLCKLSNIMAAILIFQEHAQFSRNWNGENTGDSVSELKQIAVFYRALKIWKDDLETWTVGHIGTSEELPVSFYILRILHE